MATTYTPVLVTELDIRETYKELMEASTEQGSLYIRAKETLEDIFQSGIINNADKSNVVAKVISDMAIGMSANAMNMAYQIALTNRDAAYDLTKKKEDTRLVTAQISKLEKDDEKAEAEKQAIVWSNYAKQGELYRHWGIASYMLNPDVDVVVPQVDFIASGTKVNEEKLTKATLYTTYAKSWRQDGLVTMAVDGDGKLTSGAGTDEGQSFWQNAVTERQYKGFDDNQRQHVANSSASMISMLLSTETAGIDYTPYLTQWNSALTYLNTNTPAP